MQAEERQHSARPARALVVGGLGAPDPRSSHDPTRALARFTLTWPSPSEVPLSSDFASCVPRVVSSLPDASVFVVSAVGVSTWLEPCRSLFSAGLLSASPGNSASSTYVVFRRHHHSLQDSLLSTIVRLRQAPSFALEYASFLATSEVMRSKLLRQDTATTACRLSVRANWSVNA